MTDVTDEPRRRFTDKELATCTCLPLEGKLLLVSPALLDALAIEIGLGAQHTHALGFAADCPLHGVSEEPRNQ